jgi:hypothetical protein
MQLCDSVGYSGRDAPAGTETHCAHRDRARGSLTVDDPRPCSADTCAHGDTRITVEACRDVAHAR